MKVRGGLIGLCALLSSATAFADEPDQKATAQVLFDQGRELVMQKRFAEACPKLAESLRLDPGLGTMLWLADCYENQGRTASAWAEFKAAASVAARQKDSREAVARRRAAQLEPRLNKLTILLPPSSPTAGVTVQRDGVALEATDLGAPYPIDPGVHTIVASAPGKQTWRVNVDVDPARTTPLLVNVPVLDDDPNGNAEPSTAKPIDSTPAPAPVAPPPEVAPATEPGSSWTAMRIAGLSIAAAGLVGVGIGGAFGLEAKSELDASNEGGHCRANNQCDAVGKEHRNDALSSATVSTIGFIAGGAALVGGLTLFFLAPKKSTGLIVAPTVFAGGAGTFVSHRF